MERKMILSGGVLAVLGCAVAVGAAELAAPTPVSPGSGRQVETVPASWPTFSWAAVAEASGYRLVVYELTAEGELGRAVIRQALAAGASSWSAPLRQGLEPGGSYAWTVGAVSGRSKISWSEPALFRVAPGPGERELEAALAVVRRYRALEAESDVGQSGGAGEAAQRAEVRPEAGVSEPGPLAPAGTELSVEGNVDAGSFSGVGSLLTELDPGNLSAGTADIDITGTATPSGAAGGELAGTYPNPSVVDAIARDVEVTAAVAAHAGSGDHDSRYYTETEMQVSGSAIVHWDNLTSLPTTTKGDLLVEDGADVVRLPVGTDGDVLVADSAQAAGVAWSSAPLYRLLGPAAVPKTGQTTSYGAGDDGDLERGVSWPNPRFTDNGDGTVTDNLTGLIWLDDANCFGTQTWANALAKANALFDGCSDCGGGNDDCGLADGSSAGEWRLPHLQEILSLRHYGVFSPAVPNSAGTGQWTEGDPFTGLQSNWYWSSTTVAVNTGDAWVVDMANGNVTNNTKTTSSWYVWPVSGGQ